MPGPNQLTVTRIILTPVFAVMLAIGGTSFTYLSFVVFVVASLTDWFDGYLARKQKKITSTGKYLDPLADKLLVSTAFGVFSYLGYVEFWMFLVILSRDVLITGLRSYTIFIRKPFSTANLAKWKTAFQIVAVYLIFLWIIIESTYAAQPSPPAFLAVLNAWGFLGNLMWLVTIFTITTGLSYMYENRRHLKSLAVACYRVFVPTNIR